MWKTKGGVYVGAVLMLVMILFINANPSKATSLVLKMSSNNSASGSGCFSIHDCLIADHQSLEFLLGPEMVSKKFVVPGSVKRSKPIVNCGRGKSYKNCLPHTNNPKTGENCFDTYGRRTGNRGC
ncbi:hypothetical protein Ddye_027205 [Dipteronia dyeriana]|uniref:Rapid ALkalinization Factor n=1 Tax=Dipteronia dyeriana TaxID=168575 RepID=A0AAD9TNP2_9ROSI|nr:hypothetical protein Ddye_027205 [Dipteronia dyeriana]